MIKNRIELLNEISQPFARRRRILLYIADYVLANLSPAKLLKNALRKKSLKAFNRVVVIGIGKAARGMVKAILPLIDRKPSHILLADIGHPLPTKRGLQKTKKIISAARSLDKKDLAIVLISGGGSAMLVAPAPGITLSNKIHITSTLLKSGATIQEINVVRKHLSQVKGGNLARLLYPATVLGLVISDVVGNDLSTIASGPLSPDKSTFQDALKILKKYHIASPKQILETPKPGEEYFKKVKIHILADHGTVLKIAEQKARRMGLRVISLSSKITGEARNVAKWFVSKSKKNTILMGSGETTVTCVGSGFGGRNQEFVLSGLQYIKKNQTLLCLATDGVDGIGPKPVAGAVADSITITKIKQKKLSIEKFLKQNDSYRFFQKVDGHIKTGPTGTNVGDLMMLISGDQ